MILARLRRMGLAICSAVAVLVSPLSAAAPELTRLFPAGGSAGSVVDVTLSGKFPDWPINVHCSSPNVRWETLEEKGKLRATIADNATAQLCWIRLYHLNGASTAKPFVIAGKTDGASIVPEVVETEPNNSLAEAMLLDGRACVVNGALEKSRDVDTFALDLKAGVPLMVSAVAHQGLRSPVDLTLQILDNKGFVLAQNLDRFGLDPSLHFDPPREARYWIRVFGFPANPDSTIAYGGKEDWVYRLRLSDDRNLPPPVTVRPDTIPSAKIVDASAANAPMPIEIPGTFRGTLARAKEKHRFQFSLRGGTYWRFAIRGREKGAAIDPVLTIEDAQDKQLVRQDDTGDDPDPELEWKSPADGEYRLSVSDLHQNGGEDYFYWLTVEPTQPAARLTVDKNLIHGTVDQQLEIAVTIQRTLGFDGEMKLIVEGLPSEMTQTESISQGKGETSKKANIKLTGNKPFQGPIRVGATHPSFGDQPRFARVTDDAPLWLSIIPPTKP